MKSINAKPGFTHEVDRLLAYDRVLQLYESKAESIILEYSMYVHQICNKAGVDEGGVQRDMLMAFWDIIYDYLKEQLQLSP